MTNLPAGVPRTGLLVGLILGSTLAPGSGPARARVAEIPERGAPIESLGLPQRYEM